MADETSAEIPAAVAAAESGEFGETEETGTEIRDTDIVFDCPHCGHNLAIDYRGAGLQISCVNCGESVLVPIPSGMKIDDLDLEPGEILKQLFSTRRSMQRDELRLAELEAELAECRRELEEYRATVAGISARVSGILETCFRQQAAGNKVIADLQALASEPAEPAAETEEGETPAE